MTGFLQKELITKWGTELPPRLDKFLPFEVHIKFLLCSPSALYEQTPFDISDLWHFPLGEGNGFALHSSLSWATFVMGPSRGLQAVFKWMSQWHSRLSKLGLVLSFCVLLLARGRTARSARVNGAGRGSPWICCPACPRMCRAAPVQGCCFVWCGGYCIFTGLYSQCLQPCSSGSAAVTQRGLSLAHRWLCQGPCVSPVYCGTPSWWRWHSSPLLEVTVAPWGSTKVAVGCAQGCRGGCVVPGWECAALRAGLGAINVYFWGFLILYTAHCLWIVLQAGRRGLQWLQFCEGVFSVIQGIPQSPSCFPLRHTFAIPAEDNRVTGKAGCAPGGDSVDQCSLELWIYTSHAVFSSLFAPEDCSDWSCLLRESRCFLFLSDLIPIPHKMV